METVCPSRAQVLRRNRLEYDDAADPYWRHTVYDALHGGWWFSNIGGRRVLDFVGRYGRLGPGSRVLELCSGLGDTCAYLASRFGCEITGLEINHQQVLRARARQATRWPALRSRVRFLERDVLCWTPRRRFDLVYAIDALMLLEDRRRALAEAVKGLAPGGRLVLADVLAGPRHTDAVGRFTWSEDGILTPHTRGDQEALLRQLGLRRARSVDLTRAAESCFRRMDRAARRHRTTLVEAKGWARYLRWRRNARIYARCFRERSLEYVRIAAELPARVGS